jgi:GT2 family glycosyltransferase
MANIEKSIDLSGRKLMVCIPAYDGKLNIDSAFALSNLAVQVVGLGVKLYLTHFSNCSLITKARNGLVADFLASDADTMLFVDADVVITADLVLRLLALSIGKDITAGIYPRRGMDRKFFLDYHLNEQGALEFDASGFMRVKRIGTGFMMIQRHVLETMRDKHPEWAYENNVTNRTEHAIFDLGLVDGQYYGEDYLFCDRAAKEGFTIYLDPTISLPHVGSEKFIRSFEEDVLKPLMIKTP